MTGIPLVVVILMAPALVGSTMVGFYRVALRLGLAPDNGALVGLVIGAASVVIWLR